MSETSKDGSIEQESEGGKVAAKQTPGPAVGKQYDSGVRSRDMILEAAMVLFSERAYSGVSMRDVAAVAGLTHAGVRYHYPSKDDLLLGVLNRYSQMGDKYYERALQHLAQEEPDLWGVLSEFTSYLRFTLRQRVKAQMFIMHAILAADKGHPAHEFFEERYRLIRRQFTEVIGLLKEHGYFREDVDVEHSAIEIIAMADGLQVQWLINPSEVPYRPIIKQAICRMLRAEHQEQYDQMVDLMDVPGQPD